MRYILPLFLLFFSLTVYGQHGNHQPAQRQATLLPGMGDVNHPVSTENPEAQKFFNQGLALLYGFNHDEAILSFKRAAKLDPNLAMAYWGAALALGSNYNLQADPAQLKEAFANLQKAIQLAPKASEHERAYIEALSKRYSSDPKADQQKLAANYKAAMAELVKKYPDDLDAATLYAESMMNLRPWKLWTPDGKPAEGTLEIVAVLESVLKRNPKHTGANHYYIHAIEASKNPERGLASAARLGKLAPAAGHLVHMPSHIYIRTGDYVEAATSNADAIVADRKYLERTGAQGAYPMMYYNHNIHFLAAAHAMNGRFADALKTAQELESNVKPHLKAMPMLEFFMPYTTVALVRFQKWDEMLKAPKPDENLKITTAFWHFGRGMAFAGIKQTAKAETELKSLQSLIQVVPADTPFGNSAARDVLKVGENLLAGQILLAKGDKTKAIEQLRKAVEAEKAVGYNEPPDWDLPIREWLGGALLLSGDSAAAEQIFREEIEIHPRNGRALFGLHESLKRQKKDSAARFVQSEFERAWENSDTKLRVENLAGEPNTNENAVKSDDVSNSASTVQIVKTSHNASDTTNYGEHSAPKLTFSDVKLKTDVRLRYAEQGDPNGQTIILLHGYSDSSFSYSRILPLLNPKYHVFALDQRGHGDSERPKNGYKFDNFAADVVAFMDAKNIKRAIVVGHSMGSFVAQGVALAAPKRVEKLVLIGSATTVRNDVVLELQKAVNEFKDTVPGDFVRDFQISTSSPSLPSEFLNSVIAQSMKLPARVWRETMKGMLSGDYKTKLDQIKVPTLIFWGDKETVFLRQEQDLLKARIANSVLKVYPGTGHSPHWEQPEKFAKDLENFVSGK
ncbi:MAG: alpha/beta fold hydrolase [Acidobacteriota bacterium]|nr:alpha/beta fold hydrolase [Acidobacteriota bacterium]